MRNKRRHSARYTSAVSAAVVVALLGSLAFPAPQIAFADPADTAAPSTDESTLPLEDQVVLFESRIDTLSTNLEITSEEINLAREQLATVREKIAQREKDLASTREEYEKSRKTLAGQARSLYREGSASYIEILLSSNDISSLLSKYDFISRMAQQQKDSQTETSEHKTALEEELKQLKQDELEAQSLEFELEAKQIEMNHRKEEYEKLFADANAQVLAQYQTNKTASALRDQQALLAFLSGGYTVEPGGVVETALAYRGIPYVWGGESKSGMDCSGLVLYVFKQHGVTLPHSSQSQSKLGTPVAVNQLQPGDAVFFGSPVHHVGIYIGGEYFIHAPTFGDVVKISKLSVMGDYVGARRYDWQPRTGEIL